MAEPDPRELAYQMARKDEYSCSGLAAFTISGIVIISIAITLRFISRKLSKNQFTADDWTLLIAWLLTVCAQAMYLCNNLVGRTCYHTLTISPKTQAYQNRHWYAWGLLYTTGYPLARISLCLLYARVFVKRWFRLVCYFLIFCFAGYAIGSAFADIFATLPIEANWNFNVKAKHTIVIRTLFMANACFNIATDVILLIMPVAIIWQLRMNWPQKLGLSAVFCLGGLTVIASIFRLTSYLAWEENDPNFILQAEPQWWTIAELNLGILCPCLVAFGPLIRTTYFHFSSRTSSPFKTKLDRMAGVSSDGSDPYSKNRSRHFEKASSTSHSLKSKPSNLEAGTCHVAEHMPTRPPTGKQQARLSRAPDGMALNQVAALANLDPRVGATDTGFGEKGPLGTSASAGTERGGRGAGVPGHKIGVSRDYKLERE